MIPFTGGACMVAGGHVWLPGAMHGWGGVGGCWADVHGYRGGCMVARGHVWLPGAMHGWGVWVVARGMCGYWGHVWLGGCAWLPGGMCS